MFTILALVVGVVVGWLVPEPQWVADLRTKVLSWFKSETTPKA